MPIGNPVTLTSNVASKTISVTATASQTLFNVTGGYRINSLGVFKNGSRLQDGVDYIARDGLTVTLLSAASGGDKLQFVVFDTFRVAEAIRPAVDEQTIRGNLNVVGILSCTDLEGPVSINITSGIQTFHDVRVGGALTVAGSLTYEDTTNTNTTGIATFSGGMNISGVGATITALNVTGVSTFAGNINANGNIVGDNSTNISGINQITATTFSGDGSGLTGVASTDNIITGTAATFNNNVNIDDSIIHVGDTNTKIRFPAADTFSVETGGTEALRIDSSQRVLIGHNSSLPVGSSTPGLQLHATASANGAMLSIARFNNDTTGGKIVLGKSRNTSIAAGTVVQDGDTVGAIEFAADDGTDLATRAAEIRAQVDGTPGSNDMPGRLLFMTTADNGSGATERLRIASDGSVGIGTTNPDRLLHLSSNTNTRAKIATTSVSSFGQLYLGDEEKWIVGYRGSHPNEPHAIALKATNSSGYINLFTGGDNERLRIGSSGQIGLGGANYGTAGQVITSNGSGSAPTWQDAAGGGITTTKYSPAANATIQIGLGTAQHHELRLSAGFTTVTTSGGSFGESHSLVLVQPSSGICTVGFSTFFQFPSGATPSMSEGGSKVDLVSFVVKDIAGNAGTGATELLASAGLNYQ